MTGWKPHLLCLAVLGLELGLALLTHRSSEDLERAWREGSVEERLDALHILANRDHPDPKRFDAAFLEALYHEKDDRLKEAAFTIDLCKFRVPDSQREYLKGSLPDASHWWRVFVIHARKVGGYSVGGGTALSRVELAWYLDALRDFPPPMDAVRAHLRGIADLARRRQEALGIVPPHAQPGAH